MVHAFKLYTGPDGGSHVVEGTLARYREFLAKVTK